MFNIFSQYPTFVVFLASCFPSRSRWRSCRRSFARFARTISASRFARTAPKSHLVKQGTPGDGRTYHAGRSRGNSAAHRHASPETFALVIATVLAGALGLADDDDGVKERSLGLTPKAKLIGQFIIATAFCLVAVNFLGIEPTVDIPFIVQPRLWHPYHYAVGGFSVPWLYLIFVNIITGHVQRGESDRRAWTVWRRATVMIVMMVMAAIGFRSDSLGPASWLRCACRRLHRVLWFNSFPADIFMGDTGLLALGMALSCLAVFTKTEFVSVIIGGLFVAEALSVMIQVFYYKKTHKRIFLMAPLHHHFEKKGWSETKVVVRFWIVSGVLAAIGFFIYFVSPCCGGGVAHGVFLPANVHADEGKKYAPEHLGRVLVLGLGKSGHAALDYLLPLLGARVDALAVAAGGDTPAARADAERAKAAGAAVEFGNDAVAPGGRLPRTARSICASRVRAFRQISLYFQSAAQVSSELVSEVEFAWREIRQVEHVGRHYGHERQDDGDVNRRPSARRCRSCGACSRQHRRRLHCPRGCGRYRRVRGRGVVFPARVDFALRPERGGGFEHHP